jgi:phosphomannomutase
MALLQDLQGSRPVLCGERPDGNFAHPPEPLAENLTSILPRVVEARADVGFVLDPDADRLAIIDETGRYIGEELTLALAVRCRLRQERGPVVINMSSSRVVEDIARQFSVPCHRAAVGEANVVERMRASGAMLGGEGNGGVIDPRVGWVRDPFIGMALVLDLMAETGQTLSQLARSLPNYTIVKDKYEVARDRLPQLNAALQARWPEAQANTLDGLRLDWADRWVHVRPSNTEPIVRVIAEAPAAADAERLCREVGQLLQSV